MASETILSHSDKRFRVYPLIGLLPAGHMLVLDAEQDIVTQVTTGCSFLEQQSLTTLERSLIVALLESYPYHCPEYEVLALYSGSSVEQCREKLNWAHAEGNGAVDALMRPVRNLISRARVKLHPFGIEVKSIVETGYLLMPLSAKRGAA